MVRSDLNHFRRRDSAVGEGGGENTAAAASASAATATVRAMFGGLYRLNPAGAADLAEDLLLDSVQEAEEAMEGGPVQDGVHGDQPGRHRRRSVIVLIVFVSPSSRGADGSGELDCRQSRFRRGS